VSHLARFSVGFMEGSVVGSDIFFTFFLLFGSDFGILLSEVAACGVSDVRCGVL